MGENIFHTPGSRLVDTKYKEPCRSRGEEEPNVKETQAKTSMGSPSRTHEKMFRITIGRVRIKSAVKTVEVPQSSSCLASMRP